MLLAAGAELAELVSGLCRLRRESPTGDLVTALAEAEVDGERLTDAEIASFFVLLSVAGNETTRNAISHALVALTDNPEQQAAWRDDFEALAPGAVEEIVRWSSPVIWMRRTVLADTPSSAASSCAGDRLLLFYPSGNRDETVFDDAGALRSAPRIPIRTSDSAARARTTASALTSPAARSRCSIASCCSAFRGSGDG